LAEEGVGGDGVVDGEEGGEFFHVDDDRAAGLFEDVEGVGGDEGEGLAEEDGFGFDYEEFVLDGGAERVVAGDVAVGKNGADARDFARGGEVEVAEAAAGVG
jgi:hypothetical protein